MHKSSRFLAALVLAAASLFAQAAQAQYVWTDEKGTRQYSDIPPPLSVPADRIIKKPAAPTAKPSQNGGPVDAEQQPAAAKSEPSPATSDLGKAPATVAEKNADYNRRKAEREEKEKKAAEAARIEAEKTKQCERAREYRRILDTGQRVATVNANGERLYLTEERRNAEAAETARILADCR